MSNNLLRLAHRVTGLPAMARQVLVVLADEARDARGGVSTLTTAQIADRTGLSRRTIHRAYVILAEAGHISRGVAAPGAYPETTVHPAIGVRAPGADLAEGSATVSAPPCQPVRGVIEYIDSTIDHSPRASAREVDFIDSGTPVAEAAPADPPAAARPADEPAAARPADEPAAARPVDEIDQVFAAWDAWRGRAGLPGPVMRTAARAVAVDKAVRANGLGKVLMMIDTIEREVRAGNFRRKNHKGQDNIWATFDAAFEIGHAASLNLLTRLLDGDFGALEVRRDASAATGVAADDRAVGGGLQLSDRPAPERRLRSVLRERLGTWKSSVWIDPLRFEFGPDGVVAVAPGAFHADYLMTNLAAQLRRAAADAGAGGIVVRIRERERV